MPAFEVHRSLLIEAAPQQVYNTVVDFRTWPTWSPWLCVEPDTEVVISDDPSSLHSAYRWQGKLVGAGEIEHVALDPPYRIEDKIRFEKPFRSTSRVGFTFEGQGNGTKVTWSMQGNLPWFMFWMRSSMQTYIGMDYQRGLKMLKDKIETGTVLSTTKVGEIESVPSLSVMGVQDKCSTQQVGPAMEKAFQKASKALTQAGESTAGAMVSVYHQVCLKTSEFDFSCGFVVEPSTQEPDGVQKTVLPAGRALRVRHTGSYDHLGNAWSAAYQVARYRKLKLDRRKAYEIYRNHPDTAATADLVTDLYLPVK